MNDVTLNPLVCNCQMLHFIAGHLMVYLFMLDFMTVTAVSQQRSDPFLSGEASFEIVLPYMPSGWGRFPLTLGIVLQPVCIGGNPRKQEFSTGKSEMEKEEKTMQIHYQVDHRVAGMLVRIFHPRIDKMKHLSISFSPLWLQLAVEWDNVFKST